MNDQGRRIVVDRGFEAIVAETGRAIREEGLQVIARIDDVLLPREQQARCA